MQRSNSSSYPFLQVIFVVLLMGIIAWLATGWQETPPMQLSYEQDNSHTKPWSEEHLIMPVASQTHLPTDSLQAM